MYHVIYLLILCSDSPQVGLIYKGNEEQIPLYVFCINSDYMRNSACDGAYELYADPMSDGTTNLAKCFKDTFSRKDARVHFIGVWCVASASVVCLQLAQQTDPPALQYPCCWYWATSCHPFTHCPQQYRPPDLTRCQPIYEVSRSLTYVGPYRRLKRQILGAKTGR